MKRIKQFIGILFFLSLITPAIGNNPGFWQSGSKSKQVQKEKKKSKKEKKGGRTRTYKPPKKDK